MALPFFALVLALIVSVPLWLRFRRNLKASRRLAAQADADTLSPRDRLAVALAYPHEVLIDGRVHETQGAFGVVGAATARDRRIYIGDLWVRVHESLLDAIAPQCTARIVRAWDKALVVELNGVPVLSTLVEGGGPDKGDPDYGVRLLDERCESSADYRLRLSDDAVESGGLRVMSAILISVGAIAVMLALPSVHPVWFGLGCLPLAWGLLIYRPGPSVGRYDAGERLFRVRGRVTVAETVADFPDADRISHLSGDLDDRVTQMIIHDAATGPVLNSAQPWPAVLIGNIVFRYPAHWIDTLRRRTPETVDVWVTPRGEAIMHGTLSRYDELRRFPPVRWLSHAVMAGLAGIAVVIALFSGTPAYRTPADIAQAADAMDGLERLPSTLAFYGLVGLGLYHGVGALLRLQRRRDRKARLANWLDAQ